jgi:hypothetical protein
VWWVLQLLVCKKTENHLPVTSGFLQCTKTEENFLKTVITVTKHGPMVMIQNYAHIKMGIPFLAKDKLSMPSVHQNQSAQ